MISRSAKAMKKVLRPLGMSVTHCPCLQLPGAADGQAGTLTGPRQFLV
jgi:hypothetical protein